MRKTLIFVGMTVGSLIGGYIPMIFGVGLFSFSSIIGNAVGGIIGVWVTYKYTEGL